MRPTIPSTPQIRNAEQHRFTRRRLVALLGIFVLIVTLTNRTVSVRSNVRSSVSSQTQKAKIQHLDKDGSKWSPSVVRLEPFYVVLCSEVVEPEQEPLRSVHV